MNPAIAIQVKSLDHVTLVVGDMEKSRQFYVELLGMQQVARPAFPFPGMWFQAGDTQIHINEASPEAGSPGWGKEDAPKLTRAHHFAFEVDDAAEAAEYLRGVNQTIVEGPRPRPDGITQLYIRDPDGHLVELFSYPMQG